ncbi:MAG: 50S ribosomal protein L11 methyltransferase [Deltaproteobacteria bacterium]|nr:50S ribosomal protein L11 methyltransferase [Deltaproteobacteria bacterium]
MKEDAGLRRQEDTIYLGPGPGFGSGRHPTTRGCLGLMESFFEGGRPARVLDAGCGSGILSIAASLLGARTVLGVEVEKTAAATARRNVGWNNVQDVVTIFRGDLQDVLGSYDLILANLDPGAAAIFGVTLGKRLVSGGHLILSGLAGFETDHALKRLVQDRGLNLLEHLRKGGWSTLLLNRPKLKNETGSTDA